MELRFKVAARISRPLHEVFEAVADPAKLSSYFTTGGASGRLEPGATVDWEFHDFPGVFPVHVIEVVPDSRIVLEWEASEGEPPKSAGYSTRVTMSFSELEDGRTLVEIAEQGWRLTDTALGASYGNCQGWTEMLCSLKAWMEFGVRLREGLYR